MGFPNLIENTVCAVSYALLHQQHRATMFKLCLLLAIGAVAGLETCEDWGGNSLEGSGRCFKASASAATFEAAVRACDAMGGKLGSIKSESENDLVAEMLEQKGVKRMWIGYTDSEKEGEWKWVDESDSEYSNWAWGRPDNYRYSPPAPLLDDPGTDVCA